MQNIKTLADLLLVDLIDKESKKQNISKNEFDIMMETYKKGYEDSIKNNNKLTSDQKNKLKELYDKAADSIKDYCQECLRIDGRLIE